jgi:hypothetical protein
MLDGAGGGSGGQASGGSVQREPAQGNVDNVGNDDTEIPF